MSDFTYICGGRSTGKTRKLLEQAKANNALVICKNPYAMARKAEAYGIFGLRFVSYGEVINGVRNEEVFAGMTTNDLDVVIDEVKDFFDYLLAANCIGFTITEGD